MQSNVWLSAQLCPFLFWKLLFNFLNELQDIIRIPICEASVTKPQSQRQRPVPRKWKCHSHPVSVCELALFLAPVWLGVWLLRVRMRRLINTNLGLNQIWEGTGRYSVPVSDLARVVSQYYNLSLCKYVKIQQHSLGIRSTLHSESDWNENSHDQLEACLATKSSSISALSLFCRIHIFILVGVWGRIVQKWCSCVTESIIFFVNQLIYYWVHCAKTNRSPKKKIQGKKKNRLCRNQHDQRGENCAALRFLHCCAWDYYRDRW